MKIALKLFKDKDAHFRNYNTLNRRYSIVNMVNVCSLRSPVGRFVLNGSLINTKGFSPDVAGYNMDYFSFMF